MKVHELLSSPEKWTQGTYARDAKGRTCWFNDPDAVCWCLYGAIRECYPSRDPQEMVLRRIRLHLSWENIVFFNDAPERTYEEVYNLVKELDV